MFRTSNRRNPVTGATYPRLVPGSGVVNQYYFYCADEDFGPVCVKFSGYFPYTGRLILDGNQYAKRQAAKAGHSGSSCWITRSPPWITWPRCRRSAAGLDEEKITALAARLLAMLPYPFTAEDTAAGYRYELSVLQAEFSPHPDAGRPGDRADLLRSADLRQPRHRPPGPRWPHLRAPHPARPQAPDPGAGSAPASSPRASPRACTSTTRTRKSSNTTKLGKALRTETTINDARDFGVAKGLSHLPELKEIGPSAADPAPVRDPP